MLELYPWWIASRKSAEARRFCFESFFAPLRETLHTFLVLPSYLSYQKYRKCQKQNSHRKSIAAARVLIAELHDQLHFVLLMLRQCNTEVLEFRPHRIQVNADGRFPVNNLLRQIDHSTQVQIKHFMF